MTSTITPEATTARTDWVAVARDLGPGFAARAAAFDANDSFGAENFRELRDAHVFSAPVPVELGGGGASYPELCAMLRELGRHCGATALSLSMHTHLVATSVYQHHHGAPVAPLLQRIAAEQLVLVTSGASDWVDSNGSAERVDGGFLVTARKPFVSGSPAGDILITSTVYDDPVAGPTVLQFSTPMKADGVTVLDNWRTMAMRASGSNDVVLDRVFVPDAAVVARRPRGAWSPMLNVVAPIVIPLVMSVYLGVAETARGLALERATTRRDDESLWYAVGEMENALATGRLAVEASVAHCADYIFEPGPEALNATAIQKTIAAESLILAVEKALEVAGGGGIYRAAGLERLVRDIHAARFHPLQAKRQHRYSGRLALGLDPNG